MKERKKLLSFKNLGMYLNFYLIRTDLKRNMVLFYLYHTWFDRMNCRKVVIRLCNYNNLWYLDQRKFIESSFLAFRWLMIHSCTYSGKKVKVKIYKIPIFYSFIPTLYGLYLDWIWSFLVQNNLWNDKCQEGLTEVENHNEL